MKGEGMHSSVKTVIGILIVLVLVGGLAGTIFSSVNSTNLGTNAPSWAVVVFPIIAGVAVLLVILKVAGVY